jgi:hypothetical protein
MPNIAIQLDRLTSPNKNKRYDACEELRVAAHLPPEAISALEAASNDSGTEVTDTARRALLAHQQVETPSISISADSESSAELEVASMYKSIRSWAIGSILLGGLSILASGTFNPGWGIVVIVIGLLSWKIKTPAMFAVYSVMIGWAAVMNGVWGLQSKDWVLLIFALLQVYWTVSIVRPYRRYRTLRLKELFEAGKWLSSLARPADEAVVSNRFSIASTILAGITMIILPLTCIGTFGYSILMDNAITEQGSSLNETLMQVAGIVMDTLIGIAVLALGLGVAAMLSGSKRKGLAIAGTVMSAIVLVSWIGLMILMTMLS